MKKLLTKLAIKILNYLANHINCDFNQNEKNDLLEVADMLSAKLKK